MYSVFKTDLSVVVDVVVSEVVVRGEHGQVCVVEGPRVPRGLVDDESRLRQEESLCHPDRSASHLALPAGETTALAQASEQQSQRCTNQTDRLTLHIGIALYLGSSTTMTPFLP